MCPKIRAAVSFVEANLHRDIYVTEVAQQVRLSRSRLPHLFKGELGMPLTQYLKSIRMEKACQLLQLSFQSVKAIAVEVGYNDAAHFEREFKKVYGSTPLQYRANYCLVGSKEIGERKQEDSLTDSTFL